MCDQIYLGPNCSLVWSELPIYSNVKPLHDIVFPAIFFLGFLNFFSVVVRKLYRRQRIDIFLLVSSNVTLAYLFLLPHALLGYGARYDYSTTFGKMQGICFSLNLCFLLCAGICLYVLVQDTFYAQVKLRLRHTENPVLTVQFHCLPLYLAFLIQIILILLEVFKSPDEVARVSFFLMIYGGIFAAHNQCRHTGPLLRSLRDSKNFPGRGELIWKIRAYHITISSLYASWFPLLVIMFTPAYETPTAFIVINVYMYNLTMTAVIPSLGYVVKTLHLNSSRQQHMYNPTSSFRMTLASISEELSSVPFDTQAHSVSNPGAT